jgi:hypothetical protein
MSDTILAIDPGCTQSAFVLFDGVRPGLFGKWPNESLLRAMTSNPAQEIVSASRCVIERVGHYGTGMAVGAEVFDTCYFTGRLIQSWFERTGGEKFGGQIPDMLQRQTIKAHLCGSSRANDSNVRQALIDRWGGDSKAIGGKKCKNCKGTGNMGTRKQPMQCHCASGCETPPGPLKGVTADVWAALALAVTFWDTCRNQRAAG